jgi:hypothetical protein
MLTELLPTWMWSCVCVLLGYYKHLNLGADVGPGYQHQLIPALMLAFPLFGKVPGT